MITRLLEMLGTMRPHGSEDERAWVKKYIMDKYPHEMHDDNVVIVTDPNAKTLFSCHTDTVHSKGGDQIVGYDKNLLLMWKDDDEPLGADDCAGVCLLLEMIDAGIPGTYIFHYGEERGGIGSSWMKENRKEFLEKFSHAVAFDRRGDVDLITHQGGTRCCSDEFATALCEQLNAAVPVNYSPCTGGSFTDTKKYIGIIPECTNIAVGYAYEHTHNEMLDAEHLMLLREAVLKVDWASLPAVRKPEEPVYSWGKSGSRRSVSYGSGGFYGDYGWPDSGYDDEYWSPRQDVLPLQYGGSESGSKVVPLVSGKHKSAPPDYAQQDRYTLPNLWHRVQKNPRELNNLTYEEFSRLAWNDPESFADVVWTLLKVKRNAKARR